MLRIRKYSGNNMVAVVLVNRLNTKFNGKYYDGIQKFVYNNTIYESIKILKPEEMFEDFPELKELNDKMNV